MRLHCIAGIDFDAPDGKLVQLVFLLLTPAEDDRAQLELLSDIAERCRHPRAVEQLASARGYTQLRAELVAAVQEHGH